MLKEFDSWLVELIYILRKSVFIIIMLITGCVLFWDIDQVIDVTWAIMDDGFNFRFFIFQTFIFIWAVQTWYASRTLLDFTEFKPLNIKANEFFQTWVPRIFGAFIFLIISYAYIFSYDKPIPRSRLVIFVIINVILCIIFLAFVITRRNLFKSVNAKRKIQAGAHLIKGSAKNKLGMWGYDFISIAIFIFLLILFIISKVIFPQIIGTNSIAVSFMAFFTSTFVMLIYSKKYNFIPVFAIAIIILVLFSYTNNNHEIRLIPDKQTAVKTDPAMDGNTLSNGIGPVFNGWYEKESANFKIRFPGNSDNPVFIIAVEGGGMRSAYWSSYLLSSLQDISTTNTNYRHLNEHIFAISSVSGGSLGSAVYLALIKEQYGLGKSNPLHMADMSGEILGRDFLSPVISSLFYPDFLQRFLPFPVPYFDRALALENALESSWHKTVTNKNNYFTNSFYCLWEDSEHQFIPNLLLNSTSVEKGNRVVISSIPFYNSFNDCVDFNSVFSNFSRRIPLSTASFLSARFPYITPAARVYKDPDKLLLKNNIWGHIDDGGYFENSGSATAYDLINSIKILSGNKPHIYAIVIKDDPVVITKPSRWCYEITQPVLTFFNTWISRTPYSTSVLKNMLGESNVVELNLFFSGNDIPVGWFLSGYAQNFVKEYVNYLLTNNTAGSITNITNSGYGNILSNLTNKSEYNPENEKNILNMRKLLKLLKVH